jgi:hypothetical protein
LGARTRGSEEERAFCSCRLRVAAAAPAQTLLHSAPHCYTHTETRTLTHIHTDTRAPPPALPALAAGAPGLAGRAPHSRVVASGAGGAGLLRAGAGRCGSGAARPAGPRAGPAGAAGVSYCVFVVSLFLLCLVSWHGHEGVRRLASWSWAVLAALEPQLSRRDPSKHTRCWRWEPAVRLQAGLSTGSQTAGRPLNRQSDCRPASQPAVRLQAGLSSRPAQRRGLSSMCEALDGPASPRRALPAAATSAAGPARLLAAAVLAAPAGGPAGAGGAADQPARRAAGLPGGRRMARTREGVGSVGSPLGPVWMHSHGRDSWTRGTLPKLTPCSSSAVPCSLPQLPLPLSIHASQGPTLPSPWEYSRP